MIRICIYYKFSHEVILPILFYAYCNKLITGDTNILQTSTGFVSPYKKYGARRPK